MKRFILQNDLVWFTIFALAILAFGSIPIWMGRAAQTDELLFRGIYFNEKDYAVHISMMQAGQLGDWAYQMRFTSEEHSAAYVRIFYLVLGHLSKWFNLDVETTFHIARWLFGFAALYYIYQLLRQILPQKNLARAAFLLAVLGEGVGVFQFLLGVPLQPISPIDFWLIDAYVFFSISIFPSFSFNLALLALSLTLFLDFLKTQKWIQIFWICLFAILSQSTNPIAFALVDLAFAGAAITSWWHRKAVDRHSVLALGMIGIFQIPLLIYNFLILTHDPIWGQFTMQNATLSPPPTFYLWGFLPFWIFAPYGIFCALRERPPAMVALSVWVIFGFILTYVPVAIQRRFLLGMTIPLAALAVYGANRILQKVPKLAKRENLVYFSYILLASMSSIYLSLGSTIFIQTHPADKFYPRELAVAFEWLNEHAAPNDYVLADVTTSLLVAQKTKLKVYVGHEIETLHFQEKTAAMEAYFKGRAPMGWLEQTGVQWVIYGPYEEKNSSSFAAGPELELVYENASTKIYRVKQ